MKKILLTLLLITAAFSVQAHWTGFKHCHGSYQLMFDGFGQAYHQHIGWWHYL